MEARIYETLLGAVDGAASRLGQSLLGVSTGPQAGSAQESL